MLLGKLIETHTAAASICKLADESTQQKISGFCQHYYLEKSHASSPYFEGNHSVPLHVSLVPFEALPGASKFINSKCMCGPFKWNAWDF